MSFFAELKRRNVFKVGIAYAVAAWVILQGTDVIGEIMELPEWGGKLILLLLITGFPIALIFAWAFEMTPEGVKREAEVDRHQSVTQHTGRKLDFAIIGLLAIGLAYFVYEARFSARTTAGAQLQPADTPQATTDPVASDDVPQSADNRVEKSIAVLPFTNRSPNQDDIYFTDGVHDDLLTQLAKLDAFSVISRTSVMEYRDTEKKIGEIAGELGVANIMEGAVQRAGNQVRINVQLIDAATDEHLWAEVYDRELTTENLFKIQSEIARNIAEALHATLSDEQIAAVAEVPTKNVEAYELYQQARRFSLGETEIGFDTAIDLYHAALQLDPEFKLAWIGLAKAHITNYWNYGGRPVDVENARSAIDRARELDPDFPELYMAEGFYWYWGHLDYVRAIEYLEKAVEAMPGLAEAHMWLGWARRRNGEWDAAIEAMKESLRLDPRVVIHWTELSNTYTKVKRHQDALEAAQIAYELNPDNYWPRFNLGAVLINTTGETERAETLMIGAQHTGDAAFIIQFIEVNRTAGNFDAVLEAAALLTDEMEVQRSFVQLREQVAARALAAAGRTDEAREQARIALDRISEINQTIPSDYRFTNTRAGLHSILGEHDTARALYQESFDTMPEDAVEEMVLRFEAARLMAVGGMHAEAIEQLGIVLHGYSDWSPLHVQVDPFFNSIREEPGYIALMEEFE